MSDIDWRILDAYLAGTASAEQAEAVRRWAALRPENAELLEGMRASFASAGAEVDVDAGWRNVRQRMERTDVVPLHRKRSIYQAVGIAAALLLAVGLWQRRDDGAMREVTAPAGRTAIVHLSDGSVVTLNAGARLRHPARFRDTRDVELDGEALFVVEHDSERQFRVRAGRAIITDLGTRFVVRAFPEVGVVRVAVTEGIVSLGPDGAEADTIVLGPGMVGVLDEAGRAFRDTTLRAVAFTDWISGSVAFRSALLPEVAAELSRRFGTPIRVDAAARDRRVTATFRDETLDQALGAIGVALGLRHERLGDTVVVRPR